MTKDHMNSPGGPIRPKQPAAGNPTREGLQILVDYYSQNGCVLSKDVIKRVTPTINKTYGTMKIRSLNVSIRSKSGRLRKD